MFVQGTASHLRLKLMTFINVKRPTQTLKLIAMISVHVQLMTNRRRTCAACVINGLHREHIWSTTEKRTLEISFIHVLSVTRAVHLRRPYIGIWIFIEVNTSAQNVKNVVKTAETWQDTGEVIQERNHLNVLFVANDLQHQVTLLHTAEFTVERNHTNVTCVTRRLVSLEI